MKSLYRKTRVLGGRFGLAVVAIFGYTDSMELTPEVLRNIAAWLNTYDAMAQLLIVQTAPENEQRLQEIVGGREIQDDLLRWADELDNGQLRIERIEQ